MTTARLPLALAACVAACADMPPVTELGSPGRMHVSYAAGPKFKSSRWSPGERETMFGFLDVDRRMESTGLWLAAKLLVGSGDVPAVVAAAEPNADSTGTSELCLGLRKYVSLGRAEPFVSLGVAMLSAGVTGYRDETSNAFSIAEDLAFGGWADAGLRMPITQSFTVGLGVHYSISGDVDLAGSEIAPGGTSVLFTIGIRR